MLPYNKLSYLKKAESLVNTKVTAFLRSFNCRKRDYNISPRPTSRPFNYKFITRVLNNHTYFYIISILVCHKKYPLLNVEFQKGYFQIFN